MLARRVFVVDPHATACHKLFQVCVAELAWHENENILDRFEAVGFEEQNNSESWDEFVHRVIRTVQRGVPSPRDSTDIIVVVPRYIGITDIEDPEDTTTEKVLSCLFDSHVSFVFFPYKRHKELFDEICTGCYIRSRPLLSLCEPPDSSPSDD